MYTIRNFPPYIVLSFGRYNATECNEVADSIHAVLHSPIFDSPIYLHTIIFDPLF